ncbi:MAG: hypothetical protein Q9M91_03725 [Candidatus Dojkabacteria bacterium]|nr:hypothetical protein [Candidatus Dojkabacteria bacterium]MDQ7020924.1 hypothetical protein [Candidatus Dojkabacteria bacterium]
MPQDVDIQRTQINFIKERGDDKKAISNRRSYGKPGSLEMLGQIVTGVEEFGRIVFSLYKNSDKAIQLLHCDTTELIIDDDSNILGLSFSQRHVGVFTITDFGHFKRKSKEL